jgi:hypothetical protein
VIVLKSMIMKKIGFFLITAITAGTLFFAGCTKDSNLSGQQYSPGELCSGYPCSIEL